MKRLFSLSLFVSYFLCGLLHAQTYFPEVGSAAVHQRTLDLKSNLHVLSIALQPGFEDLASLAYFRMGKGAKVMSLYATNGEGGESDVRSEYPPQLAAVRREEAASALRHLGGEVYFLNLVDIPSAVNTEEIREQWHADSVQYRLMKIISQFRPDLILIARDQESEGPSVRWKVLVEDVLRSVERLLFQIGDTPPRELPPFARWTVNRVLSDDGTGIGVGLPTATSHTVWKKTYEAFAKEAAQRYASMQLQRSQWSTAKRVLYQTVHPKGAKKFRTPDEGLPEGVPADLQPIKLLVDKVVLGASTLSEAQASSRPRVLLRQLADAVEAIDVRLAFAAEKPSRERKILLNWKEGLENLRLTLLGVTVRYTMPETTVTDLQLVYMAIDTVTGLSDSGKTEVYFPAVGRGLILDEQLENRQPLRLKENYRLLFQHATPFSSPHWIFGLEDHTLDRPLYFFIIHKSTKREENFVHRTIIPVQYAPRFMPEVLTPIVLAVPGERLPIRLVNNSRDGVRDQIHANDSAVVSTRSLFRLNEKGAEHTDTLILNWVGELPEGSHLLPIKIGENPIGSYLARRFAVNVDSSKRIGFFEGVASSSTREALRRLGVQVTDLDIDDIDASRLSALDVLVIDRRALTVHAGLSEKREVLSRFAEGGGHVVMFAQDAGVWNSAPLMPGISLKRSLSYSPLSPFALDSLSSFSLIPNNLSEDDWSNWLFRQSFNSVTLGAGTAFGVLFRDRLTNNPLIVTHKVGTGRFTYIDMDLQQQLMNIHAGAFRLLANILAS